MNELIVSVPNEERMISLGAFLGDSCDAGLVIFLEGDLGVGKTTLARGFIRSWGHIGAVKSPTYTLVEPYEFGDVSVFHFDLYRLGDAEELEFMGIRDYFGDMAVCLVEWPQRGFGTLPPADLVITIVAKGQGRSLAFSARTKAGEAVLARLSVVLPDTQSSLSGG